jgi:hypothetical protein
MTRKGPQRAVRILPCDDPLLSQKLMTDGLETDATHERLQT